MSPTVFKKDGYRFFFFSREETRKHIHVISSDGEAKFWLVPDVILAKNYRFSEKQINKIHKVIEEHYHEIIAAWNSHFEN